MMKLKLIEEMNAAMTALYECGTEPTKENVNFAYENDDLTLNAGRDGKEYAVYSTEHKTAAVEIEAGTTLTEEEIEELLF